MPKRVIDFDAMWGSDKLASCADWAQAEYAWLYGLADANGCFEITNLRVIWGRVAAVRRNLTIERLEQVFLEFQDKGLLFVWEHEGKRYAHWTGSDVPGRLPPPSWRMRLERFAPPVPKQQLAEYMAGFARGRAAFAGVGFRGLDCSASSYGGAAPSAFARRPAVDARAQRCQERVEAAQAQDLGLDLNGIGSGERELVGNGSGEGKSPSDGIDGQNEGHSRTEPIQSQFWSSESKSSSGTNSDQNSEPNTDFDLTPDSESQPGTHFHSDPRRSSAASTTFHRPSDTRRLSPRELAVERELRVGQGPVCSPKGVKPEVIERDRLRQLAQAKSM